MKKLILIVVSVTLCLFFFTSCNKDKTIDVVIDNMYGTWKLDSMVVVYYNVQTSKTKSVVTKNSEYYLKLNPYGSAEVNLTGKKQQQSFLRNGNSSIRLGDINYEVNAFTDTQLILYSKITDENGPNYSEQTIWLMK